MNESLFENAKFGDMFLTSDNKQAVFLRFSPDNNFVILYLEGRGQIAVFIKTGDFLYQSGRIVKRKEESK